MNRPLLPYRLQPLRTVLPGARQIPIDSIVKTYGRRGWVEGDVAISADRATREFIDVTNVGDGYVAVRYRNISDLGPGSERSDEWPADTLIWVHTNIIEESPW